MSFRSAKKQLTTLVLALALCACASSPLPIKQGTAKSGATATGSLDNVPKAPVPVKLSKDKLLLSWKVIGGLGRGNFLTGTQHNALVRPTAVAARGGVVFIVDSGHQVLYQFTEGENRLSVVRELSGLVAGDVTDIYVAADRSLYITDPHGGQALHLDAGGALIQRFKDKLNMPHPRAIEVDERSGDVFIADGFYDFVLQFNQQGKLLDAMGRQGAGHGRFNGVTSLAKKADRLYIGYRFGEHHVQEMGVNGAYASSFESATVVFPTSIAVDNDDRVFVSDFFDNTIKIFDKGRLVATAGGTGSRPGRFKHITGMWFDGGLLYVADSLNQRIQVMTVVR